MNTIDEIKFFTETKESTGALLITGKWGCGKTHLIKNLAKELDANKYLVIVVSLFGVKSVELIPNIIKQKIVFSPFELSDKQMKKGVRAWNAISSVANKLKEHVGVANVASAVMSVNVLDFIPINNTDYKGRRLILVFDDFERCEIPKRELLGAINEYVEAAKIRTIIVADEDKIQGEDYFEFKEKVISHTLKYAPDCFAIIHSIIADYQETEIGYRSFLSSQEGLIRLLFEESESGNLRTLRSVFVGFERVYKCIKQIADPLDNSVMGSLLYSYGALLFEYKTGKYQDVSQRYGAIESDAIKKYSKFNEQGSNLFALMHWVLEGTWDENALKKEYVQHYCLSAYGDEQKLLSWRIWDCNDTIIRNGLNILLPQAYDGTLPCRTILKLLPIIGLLRQHNASLPVTIDYGKIKEGLLCRNEQIKEGVIDEPEIFDSMLDGEIAVLNKEEKEVCDLARAIGSDYSVHWTNRRLFMKVMDDCNADSIRDLQNRYYISFDSEMLSCFWQCYCQVDNKLKRRLGMMLGEMHFKDYLREEKEMQRLTYDNLKRLADYLVDYNKTEIDSIARVINNDFAKIIQDKCDKISQQISERNCLSTSGD